MSADLFRQEPDNQQRWDEAVECSQGVEDLGIGKVVRRYFAIVLPLILIGAAIIGLVFAVMSPNLGSSPFRTFTNVTLFVWTAAGLLAGFYYRIIGLTLTVPEHVCTTQDLSSETKKRIKRQVLGKEPFSIAEASVVRAAAVEYRLKIAESLVSQFAFPCGYGLYWLLTETRATWRIIMAVFMVAFIIANLIQARNFRQAGETAEQANRMLTQANS